MIQIPNGRYFILRTGKRENSYVDIIKNLMHLIFKEINNIFLMNQQIKISQNFFTNQRLGVEQKTV